MQEKQLFIAENKLQKQFALLPNADKLNQFVQKHNGYKGRSVKLNSGFSDSRWKEQKTEAGWTEFCEPQLPQPPKSAKPQQPAKENPSSDKPTAKPTAKTAPVPKKAADSKKKTAIHTETQASESEFSFATADETNLAETFCTHKYAIAFTDGSYKHNAGKIAYAYKMIVCANVYHDSGVYSLAAFDSNLGGATVAEILAAKHAISRAMALGCRALFIAYDCTAVKDLLSGMTLSSNDPLVQEYLAFYKTATSVMDILFIKVKGHKNSKLHNEVDLLARESITSQTVDIAEAGEPLQGGEDSYDICADSAEVEIVSEEDTDGEVEAEAEEAFEGDFEIDEFDVSDVSEDTEDEYAEEASDAVDDTADSETDESDDYAEDYSCCLGYEHSDSYVDYEDSTNPVNTEVSEDTDDLEDSDDTDDSANADNADHSDDSDSFDNADDSGEASSDDDSDDVEDSENSDESDNSSNSEENAESEEESAEENEAVSEEKDKPKPVFVDFRGETFKSLSEMARAWGLDSSVLRARLRKGWGLEKALSTPVKKYKTRKKD
jgi:ribonuclease HI